jgi:GH25 family lysozyme M1 (1,4-beta-N-acetylmuramidase)
VGVYYFSQAVNMEEAREEAQYVLDALGGTRLEYPIVFDWERITNGDAARTDGLSGKAVTLCAKAFCDTVAAAGYTPAVYFNQTLGYLSLELEELDEYAFWLASYNSKPGFHYHFDLWQYTSKGRVPGIQGDVDLNLSFRDFSAGSKA